MRRCRLTRCVVSTAYRGNFDEVGFPADVAGAAGHLADDVDTTLLAEMMVGPLFLRRLMTAEPFPEDQVGRLAAMALDPHWIDL